MHEFSIIQSIVDIVKSSAAENGVNRVKSVEIEVGKASGVVKDALEFAWQSFTSDPLLENALLEIKEIPLQVKCHNCHQVFMPDEIYESCPFCSEYGSEILMGKELRVIAIET
jgi:hydrogenase nickel incorporation protein HypA/HybF